MFKKLAVMSALVIACVLVTGCYSVKMTAPPDSDVKLMAPASQASFKKSQKNWYAVYGMVPILNAEDGVQRTIRDNGLKEVRVETKQTILDWIISGFLSFATISTTTTIIEGNAN
ncbi:MAG: hypothetical protein FWB85_07235 [Chitinispirillia bacterium]|nr:hypothetical protein [Chitinispirillia bacterium]MCL2242041.1 hypothetical protein [Chitinispirillia bacterium]